MTPTVPMTYTLATLRAAELRAEAERYRALRDCRAGAMRFAAVRRVVGQTLVRAGERLQGTRRPVVTGTAGESVVLGNLRLVR